MNKPNIIKINVTGKSYEVDIANVPIDKWITSIDNMHKNFCELSNQSPFVKIIS